MGYNCVRTCVWTGHPAAYPPQLAYRKSAVVSGDGECLQQAEKKQLLNLQNQIDALKAKYPDHVVFIDCASGLNFKRKGLLLLLQLAFDRRLQVVRVAYRDRICCCAYDLIERIRTKHGGKIEVGNNDQHPPE